LMERLKIDGYHGYVVPAKVNGKTYFRVRIGPFDGRDEAESVRQSLARQDGYRDAYLSGD
jgi:cell division septation protein DedD